MPLLLLALVGCTGSGDTGLSSPDPMSPATWIDAHTHVYTHTETCGGVACGDLTSWDLARQDDPGLGALVASIEHFNASVAAGDPLPEAFAGIADANESLAATVEASQGTLALLASLECWHDTPFRDDGTWEAACKEDVDRWLAAGAVGFKDHAGKQYDHIGDMDVTRFLGAWNRLAGWCTVSTSATEPNKECMEQPGVRYPLQEAAWREVVRYIVQDRQALVLTHTNVWSGAPERCADPATDALRSCHDVLSEGLLDFATWAGATLDPASRRRIVLAHMGFLEEVPDRAMAVLDQGLTMDTAIRGTVRTGGCGLREAFAAYPSQWVLGTDHVLEEPCVQRAYEAYAWALEGPLGETRTFETCGGAEEWTGMALSTPQVEGCGDVPADLLDRLLRTNLSSLLGR